ncbi:MAG: nicotinate phosphoribosyltransferase [Exilibacterium sp.]
MNSAINGVAGSALLTDLYQLTMMQGYFENGMTDNAVFEFFVRKLPGESNFLLALGQEQALDYLTGLKFHQQELEWLGRQTFFTREFIDFLSHWRFSGDVDAMPEGTLLFADEPVLRVVAPIAQAQLVESRIINLLQLQTLIGSKAARVKLCAGERQLVDFGLRRAHGAEAGLLAARAAYIAGFAGTATVLAGQLFDIPLFGTMAHSYIQAHERETDAFLSFARAQPHNVVLLIDTYDTEAGAHNVVRIASQLRAMNIPIKAVRLDSGDLAEHAKKVRHILDQGGLSEVGIFASSSLDEYEIRDLLQRQAPIDGFGIGSRLTTAADNPFLDCAYKLQEYAGVARRKLSENKATWPGRKQVYRVLNRAGHLQHDLLTTLEDSQPGYALLAPVMRQGQRLSSQRSCAEVRNYVREQLKLLPPPLRRLQKSAPYTVKITPALKRLAEQVDRRAG